MNDIYITLTGNVAAEPRQYSFDEGTKVTSLKVFTSHRYFDKKTGQWTDGERVCFTVRCWRALGENVAASVRAGHPVVVSGKLRIREFGPEGERRFMPEIEASAVGHDLRWGTGAFTKPERGGVSSVSKEMRDRLDEETRDWAMGTRPQRSLGRPASHNETDTTTTSDRMSPLAPWDGISGTTGTDDGTASPLTPAHDTASISQHGAGHGPTFNGGAVNELEPEPSTARGLDSDGNAARGLDSEDNAARVPEFGDGATRGLGTKHGVARTPTSEEAEGQGTEPEARRTTRTRKTAGAAMRTRDSEGEAVSAQEGETMSARRPEQSTVRRLGSKDDTIRNLGGEEHDKGRTAGGDEPGGEEEPARMRIKAAA